MKFNEKLVFLMDTTKTSNKILADNVNVDPSMISLLRTGKRGKPKNDALLRSMADFFSHHCPSSYQKEAIGEAIGQFNLKYQTDYRDISNLLYAWLTDDQYKTPNTLDYYLTSENDSSSASQPASPAVSSDSLLHSTQLFYGGDGKEKAFQYFRAFMKNLSDFSETIYISSDESNEWFFQGNIFGQDTSLWKYLLSQTNCRICHILPPTSSYLFVDVLAHWLPLYLTGRVNIFYYPHTRDRVFRRSMILIPGRIGLLSNSIESEIESTYTVVTQDTDLIQANLTIFKDYLLHCHRTMNSYLGAQNIQNCFLKYASYDMDYIQLSGALSVATMPVSCMKKIFGPEYVSEMLKNTGEVSTKSYEAFYQDSYNRFANHEIIDICCLATKEELLSHKTTQFYPGSREAYRYTYTIETYLEHLRNIIHLMKTFPKYSFVPYPKRMTIHTYMLVKQPNYALLINNVQPICALEIDQPAMIEPFYEYLTGIAESAHYSGAGRNRIIGQLENLASELEACQKES